MQRQDDDLHLLIRRVVAPMGFELWGVDHVGRGSSNAIVRVYIDHAGGITLDDCEAVSRQLSAVLDVEDPIPEHYVLEVSSPGLDRPLFAPAQFARYAGSRVRVTLAEKRAGRRRFEGVIAGIDDDRVRLADVDEVQANEVQLPFGAIDTARLVPDL
jgi:ribosome maturation factor RimP